MIFYNISKTPKLWHLCVNINVFQSKVIKNFIASQLPVNKQQYRVFCSQIKPSLKTVQKKKKNPVSSVKTPKWKKEKIWTLDALMRFSLKIMHIQ